MRKNLLRRKYLLLEKDAYIKSYLICTYTLFLALYTKIKIIHTKLASWLCCCKDGNLEKEEKVSICSQMT